MGIRFTVCLILSGGLLSFGQSKKISRPVSPVSGYKISWVAPGGAKISGDKAPKFLSFPGAQYSFYDNFLPRYTENIPVEANTRSISVRLIDPVYEALTSEELSLIKDPSKIGNEISVVSSVGYSKKKAFGSMTFIPIRRNSSSGKLEKLVSFDIDLSSSSERSGVRAPVVYAANSVLQSGTWYKMAINSDGVYRLDYAFLQGLGIDMSILDPQNIRIYGNGGGMLPPLNSASHADDLLENAIVVQDGGDGAFNPGDLVLFYGRGAHRWNPSGIACPTFKHKTNIYSDSAYYFLNTDLGPGKRIQTQASSTLPVTHTVNTFDDHAYHENESVNFIKSGNQWFGEYFENLPSYNFSFSFPNIDVSSPVSVNTSIASRYITLVGSTANYTVSCQSGSTSMDIGSTNGDSYSPYALIEASCFSFNPGAGSVLTVTVSKNTSDAVAWLDYIEVNARRALTMSGNQMLFRDNQSVGAGNIAQYNFNSLVPVSIWDVTDHANVYLQSVTGSSPSYQFILPADTLRQFVAFTGLSYMTPTVIGRVANQDLHAIGQKQYIIVAHPEFYNEAVQLGNFHETRDSLSYVVVTPQQIYNEYSSGAQDPVAIRDFVKMFYDRAATTADEPMYLLLFGDGSYDNKYRFGSSNTNFIPTYQSDNSTVYTESYVSDDYYGLLDDSEGVFSPAPGVTEAVDIGIGRFPVRTKAEAQSALNKIYQYTKTGVPPTTDNGSCSDNQLASPFGDWRNMISFIGDDEDGGLHQGNTNQGAEQLARQIDTTYDDYNIEKIYFDAYKQVSTPGGNRYPDVVSAINNRVEKGCLILNYTGHGGEVGLGHERVVEVAQINKWNNMNNMPLFFTATCEFSRYDDPERVSAGEYVFLNQSGGGIALLTTVRLVYATPNFYLNRDFYDAAFELWGGSRMPRLGDLYVYMKERPNGYGLNGRNFTLLGDPALTLAYPEHEVITDTVNNIPATVSSSDTLKALSLVTISGHLQDKSGAFLNDYDGILYPTVYDKAQNITTLSNDGAGPSPPFTFKSQKNILYKGKVSVVDGRFKFSFVVPKDIAYAYGIGRISYYAENGNEDANGFYEQIVIGGSNDSAAADNAGPQVSLYMNDTKFAFGGLTDENPDLFAVLKDENGVNTVGNGIGHDITAVMDANTDNSIVLNDYYQADLNSYKSGTIRYPFSELTEGNHTLSLKVWDVYNNSTQAYTEFVVAPSAELALSHVLNYPNPFTTKTQFFFEQNRCCQQLEVELQVFTISGKLVKNISKFVQAEGYRSDPIEWDGRDDFGDKIGKGVYVYRLRVKTTEGSTAEKFEKLVILN